MKKWLLNVSWAHLVMFCLLLGLAPFNPPHIYEKLVLLFSWSLTKPIDVFDLLMHGLPWILLLLKIFYWIFEKKIDQKEQTQ